MSVFIGNSTKPESSTNETDLVSYRLIIRPTCHSDRTCKVIGIRTMTGICREFRCRISRYMGPSFVKVVKNEISFTHNLEIVPEIQSYRLYLS